MAPEYLLGNLVVLTLEMKSPDEAECKVDRLDRERTATEGLHVSWNATDQPAGAQGIGDDAVFVWRPQGYYRRTYATEPDFLNGEWSWAHPVQGDALMLVIVFPGGYALPSVDDARPTFVRCKEFRGRMALYWVLQGGPRAQVFWKMVPLERETLKERVGVLNQEVSQRHPFIGSGVVVDEWNQRALPPPTTFIIHGHNDADVTEIKEVLHRLGLPKPVVMKEEFVRGVSLLEKFEQLASGAGFALALLTPDDLGGPISSSEISSRARQNVWLEIGWFWGRLGRDHLMVLVKGRVEFPSDLKGLECYPYESGPEQVSDRIRKFYEAHLGPLGAP